MKDATSSPRAAVSARIREVLTSTYFILNENGPLCFTIGGSDHSEHRVSIGDRHTCTCATARAGREPCEHMLFALLKVFRVPPSNPLLHSLGIREAQLEEVMKGRAKRSTRMRTARAPDAPPAGHSAAGAHSGSGSGSAAVAVTRRQLAADDTCPICMEALESGGSLVWCREGCGNSVHRQCMLVWARHRGGGGAESTTCPMCRAAWGEIGLPERDDKPRQTAALRREQRLRSLSEADAATHFGVVCSGCKGGALIGTRFRCIICSEHNLCTLCFAQPANHAQHTFECIQRPGHEWQVADREALVEAVRERAAAAAAAALSSGGAGGGGSARDSLDSVLLETLGEGSAEAQLARLPRVQMPQEPQPRAVPVLAPGPPGAAEPQEPGAAEAQAALAHSPAHCAHCGRVARKQQWFKRLGCAHHVHEACLPDWLRASHGCCPTCGCQALSAGAIAALHASARAEQPPPLVRAGSVPLAGAAHPQPHGGLSAQPALHAGPGPLAGRRRASSGLASKRQHAMQSATPGGGLPLGLALGVTGCAIGGGAQWQCGGPHGETVSAATTMALAGSRGPCCAHCAQCAQPSAPASAHGLAHAGGAALGGMWGGQLQRQSAPVRGRLVRGVTIAASAAATAR